eukprot:262181_1
MGACQSAQNREYISSESKQSQIHSKNVYNGEIFSSTIQDTESLIYSEEITSFHYPSTYSTTITNSSDDDIYCVLNHLHDNGWSQQSLSSFIELLNKNEFEFNDIDTNINTNNNNEAEIIHNFLNKNINNNTIPKCALSDLKTVIKQIKQKQDNNLQLDRLTRSYSTTTDNININIDNTINSTINSDDVRSFDKPFCCGSSCRVYKGLYVPCGQLIALKVTSRLDYINAKYIFNEYEQQKKVLPECDQLMRIYGWYSDWISNEIVIALEYMNMGSIYDSCFNINICQHEQLNNTGHKQIKINKLSYMQLKYITKQCLLGLNALHRNKPILIHCDIKPQNILINSNGDIKIGDFGLLNVLKNINDMCKIHSGTAKYFSPERINGSYNSLSDIWSLGITLIEIYNQQLIDIDKLSPFKIVENGINVNDFLDVINVPFEFIDFIQKCLIYDYKNRYSAELLLKHPFIKGLDDNTELFKNNLCFCKQFNDYNIMLFDILLMWLQEWILDDIYNNTKFFLDNKCEYLKLFVFNLSNYSDLP